MDLIIRPLVFLKFPLMDNYLYTDKKCYLSKVFRKIPGAARLVLATIIPDTTEKYQNATR